MKINVLGSEWSIEYRNTASDPLLKENDGYADYTVRRIIIANKREDAELIDDEQRRKHTLRHEIVHAFLFESGLACSWEHPDAGHEETMVDWIALQFPKLQKAFEEAGCL